MNQKLIYDIGMNNGDDTAYYLHRGYDVLAVEADPTLVAAARKRFAHAAATGKLTLLNVGIAPERGSMTFWLCQGRSEWNSFDRANATRGGHEATPIEVPTVPFRELIEEYGTPHYLKIDIETYDRHCLVDLHARELPAFISIELNAIDELLELRSLGFDRFKLVSQARHEPVADATQSLVSWGMARLSGWPVLQRAALKTRRFGSKLARTLRRPFGGKTRAAPDGWRFPLGSSGCFGEEAPGEWLTFEEAAFRWLALARMPWQPMWCDVHAKRHAASGQMTRRAAA